MTRAGERLLIVGAGMAAGRLVERLIEHGYAGRVTLVGDEPAAAYNRVLLPGLLSGSCDEPTLCTHPDAWFEANGVSLVLGRRARRIDPEARRVSLSDETSLSYDRLVLATGARAPVPPMTGAGLDGVTTLRSLADTQRLKSRVQRLHRTRPPRPPRVVVVGGGLLGLEAAQSLLDLGARVWVVHRNQRLLNRQLDAAGSSLLAGILQRRGLHLLLGASPAAIVGTRSVRAVSLDSGTTVSADLVVFATGTRCDDALAVDAGLDCDGGVLVDASMTTSRPDIFALGECARVGGATYALVEPVFAQADVLARVLVGENATFVPPPPATRLKVSGIQLYSAGRVEPRPDDDVVHVRDPRRGLHRRLTFEGRRLVGAVLLGDIAGSQPIHELIRTGAELPADSDARTRLAFALAPTAAQS